MTVDFDAFLVELVGFIAAAADLVPADAQSPQPLFAYRLVEKSSTLAAEVPSPASVLRIYDGATPFVPLPVVQIQCKTIALPDDDQSGLQRAQELHGALLDAGGRPLRMTALPHFRMNAVLDLEVPMQLSRDSEGRAEVIFNFGVEFLATG